MKRTLLALFAALLSAASVFADEVTFTPSSESWTAEANNPQSVTKNSVTVSTTNGVGAGVAEYRFYKNADFTVSVTSGNITKIEITCTTNNNAKYGPANFTGPTAGTYTFEDKVGTWTGSANEVTLTASGSQVRATQIVVTYSAEGAAPVASAPTMTQSQNVYGESLDVEITNNEENATVYYTLDGSEPSTESPSFTGASKTITINATTTVSAMAVVEGKDASSISSRTYTFPIVFANLQELVAAELESGTLVKVSFDKQPIKSIYETKSGSRNGTYFDIQKGDKDIEIYAYDLPADWVVGGTLSGTVIAPWKVYNGTWELAPESGWSWTSLSYEAPVASGIDAVNASANVKADGKVIKDGRLVIVSDGKEYNAAGQAVK